MAKKDKDWKYKYNEGVVLMVLQKYIDETYLQHFAKGGMPATEFIFSRGHGEGVWMGNVMKNAQRYGKKKGKNPDDLLKIIHYAIMLYGTNHTEEMNNGD